MAVPLQTRSVVEVRSVIWFLHARGTKASEICWELMSVYVANVISKKQFCFWCNELKNGCVNICNESRSGIPSSETGNIEQCVLEMCVKIWTIVQEVGLPKRYQWQWGSRCSQGHHSPRHPGTWFLASVYFCQMAKDLGPYPGQQAVRHETSGTPMGSSCLSVYHDEVMTCLGVGGHNSNLSSPPTHTHTPGFSVMFSSVYPTY
jgi:hypothetical protein